MFDLKKLKKIKLVYLIFNFYKFLKFQIRLTIAKVRDRRDARNPKFIPLPPAELRYRVHGSLDSESFYQVGSALSQDIRNLCVTAGQNIESFSSILDFGCGSGRVLRNFKEIPAASRIFGTDIDPEAIEWCRKNFPRVHWSVNGHQPPLPFADNSFDLIYAISVFTHLDEKYQHAWLSELQRVAMHGAIIILSVHGEHVMKGLSSAIQSEIREKGFLFVEGVTGKLKLDKLPDFYQNTFHTQDYVRREWQKYFDVLKFVERGIGNNQDAVLLRKQ